MSTIKQSIGDLPRAPKSEGFPPAKNNFVAESIAQVWYEIETGKRDPITIDLTLGGGYERARAIPEAGPFRGSAVASRCDRSLFYQLAGVPESNPPTLADAWRMATGTFVHDIIEAIAEILFADNPDVTDLVVEPAIDLRPIGIDGSMRTDLAMTYKGKPTVVELKTVGGFKFKLATTTFKGAPEGPAFGHVLQGGLAAKALGAEQLVIAYLAMENLGKSFKVDTEAARFAAEWHYNVEQLDGILALETDRIMSLVAGVPDVDDVDEGIDDVVLPPREIHDPELPDGAIATNPTHNPGSGMWVTTEGDGTIVDNGTTWMCAYCRHRDLCANDGA
jgi:hypothetical protein